MKIFKILKIELLKLKRSNIIFIIVLPILFSNIMMITDILIKKQDIATKYSPIIKDGFEALMVENHLSLIYPIILMFEIIVLSVFLFNIDVRNGSIKYILSNGVNRLSYILIKTLVILVFTFIFILINGISIILIGHIFKLSNTINVPLVVHYMYFQFFCCLGLIGLQAFLFSLNRKMSFLISINIVGVCISILSLRYPMFSKINPYIIISNSMPLIIDKNILRISIISSFLLFLLFIVLAMIIFNNSEIKGE